MLLTNHLSNFLNANRNPQLHTILLVTPTGKLLSSSSPLPSSTLRNQATLACSLWELYTPLVEDGTVQASLPSDNHEQELEPSTDRKDISSILIQLDHGIMIIRALKCSLFLVSIGLPPSSTNSTPQQPLSQGLGFLTLHPSAPSSQLDALNGAEDMGTVRSVRSETFADGISSAASDAGSANTGVGVNSLRQLRRQTEELGRCLDTELEGFLLSTSL